MAELYEELKSRVSQFNMNVGSQRPVLDQEFVYKQRFILQVCACRVSASVALQGALPPPSKCAMQRAALQPPEECFHPQR